MGVPIYLVRKWVQPPGLALKLIFWTSPCVLCLCQSLWTAQEIIKCIIFHSPLVKVTVGLGYSWRMKIRGRKSPQITWFWHCVHHMPCLLFSCPLALTVTPTECFKWKTLLVSFCLPRLTCLTVLLQNKTTQRKCWFITSNQIIELKNMCRPYSRELSTIAIDLLQKINSSCKHSVRGISPNFLENAY